MTIQTGLYGVRSLLSLLLSEGAVGDVADGELLVHRGWSDAVFTVAGVTIWDDVATPDPSRNKEAVRGIGELHI